MANEIKGFFGGASEGLKKGFEITRPTLVYWRVVAIDEGHELVNGDAPRRQEFVGEYERTTGEPWGSWQKYPSVVRDPEYGLPQSYRCRLKALDRGFELVEGDAGKREALLNAHERSADYRYNGSL